MAARSSQDGARARPGLAIVPRLVWYHLLLLFRSPIGTFISLVVPLMLLVALYLVTPEMTLQSLGNLPIAQFLTPAMVSFAVINVGFVDPVIGVTLMREQGVLRRFASSPAPIWALFTGRLVTALLVAVVAVGLVCGVGVVFLGAQLAPGALPRLVWITAAGLATFFSLGLALSALVPSAAGALPISYALLLPVAFISQVFFPAPSEAGWLRGIAGVLPVQPFANGMEATFSASNRPLGGHGLLIMGLWTLGSLAVAYLFFSAEPPGSSRERLARLSWRRGERAARSAGGSA